MKSFSIHPALFRWQWRQLWATNVVALLVAIPYVLLTADPIIAPGRFVILLAVIVHSGSMAWRLGEISSPHIGFLYAQGFSRDQIWWHTLLASLASAVLVSGCIGLITCTGLRSVVQDRLFENPWFPIAAHVESSIGWLILLKYVIAVLVMHYVWLRANQPCEDSEAGWIQAVATVVLMLWCYGMAFSHWRNPHFLSSVIPFLLPLPALLLVACWRIHRRMEVRS